MRELALIRPGDLIMVGLLVIAHPSPFCEFERVWLKVTGPLRGILLTQPIFCRHEWFPYDVLRFELRHVLQILHDFYLH